MIDDILTSVAGSTVDTISSSKLDSDLHSELDKSPTFESHTNLHCDPLGWPLLQGCFASCSILLCRQNFPGTHWCAKEVNKIWIQRWLYFPPSAIQSKIRSDTAKHKQILLRNKLYGKVITYDLGHTSTGKGSSQPLGWSQAGWGSRFVETAAQFWSWSRRPACVLHWQALP